MPKKVFLFLKFKKEIIVLKNIFKRKNLIQLLIYLVVGAVAWVVQTFSYVIGLRLKLYPSVAMIIGNGLGMIIAYQGHVRFTFNRKHNFSHKEFFKFAVTSLLGLALNISSVRVITKILKVDPHYAIIPTLLTPILTFLLSKIWTFK